MLFLIIPLLEFLYHSLAHSRQEMPFKIYEHVKPEPNWEERAFEWLLFWSLDGGDIDYLNTILPSICAPLHKTHSSYNTEVTATRNIQIRWTSFPPIFHCQNNCLAAYCWQRKFGSHPSGARQPAHSLGIELMRPADGPAVVTLVWVTNIKPRAVWILHVVK